MDERKNSNPQQSGDGFDDSAPLTPVTPLELLSPFVATARSPLGESTTSVTSDQSLQQPATIVEPFGSHGSLKDYADAQTEKEAARRQRRITGLLFLATCLSTFLVGSVGWIGLESVILGAIAQPREALTLVDFRQGFVYMLCVMSILGAHEMGHYLTSLYYRSKASLPYFIPFPFSPTGTMGAVISLMSLNRNRKELFDVGIAGPLAGLLVALPITMYGVKTAKVFEPRPVQVVRAADGRMVTVRSEVYEFHDPLAIQLLQKWLRPDMPSTRSMELNAFLMAGWVGFLVTGLNFMPLGQLDGGHTLYALFGRKALWLAQCFWWLAFFLIWLFHLYNWLLMLFLVLWMGVRHPPTRNDQEPLDAFRWVLGLVCLIAIPVLTFLPQVVSVM